MNKKIIILILISIFLGGSVFATVVTQRKIPSQTQTQTQSQKQVGNYINNQNTDVGVPVTKRKMVRLAENIKTCKPYSENMNADYMGLNIAYNVNIVGWVNNKCRLNFTAKTNGTSSSFASLYGINASDAEVLSFVPKFRCDFTKAQLEYVGDSILQEEERNQGVKNNMLKNPNNISISSIGSSDIKLLDVVFNQQACTLLNAPDLDKVMQNLLQF